MREPAPAEAGAKLRVVFVTGQLGWGGAEKQLALMASELASRGDDVRVVCLSRLTDPYGPLLAARGIPVTVLRRATNWDFGRVLALRNQLAQTAPDVVCAVGEFSAVYAHFALWGSSKRPRFVAMLRRSALSLPKLKFALVRHVFRRADVVCANSEAGRTYGVEALGLSTDRTRILRNAIPPEILDLTVDRQAIRTTLGVREGELVVTYVGRMAEAKDIPTLCRTLSRLSGGARAVRFWVIGPGLDAPPAGLPDPGSHVSWLGPRSDAAQLVAAADLALLTSSSEGTPNVVLEAMALGIPVVSTSVGDVPRMLSDGPAGLVVPVGDDGALAAAVASLLGSSTDRQAMGIAGRRRAIRDYGVEAMATSLRSLLVG
jgi:glycosyltransferase involved in cell wall biosynthesis